MKRICTALTLLFLTFTTSAQAQNWCGKTIKENVVFTQHQDCKGTSGIKVESYVSVDMNGFTVSNSEGAGFRAFGRYVSIKNGTIENNKAEGVKFDGMYNGRLSDLKIMNNVREGVLCLFCNQTIAHNVEARGNMRGVLIDNGGLLDSGNQIKRSTIIGNRIEGVLMKGGKNTTIYESWIDGNAGWDTVMETTSGCRLISNPWLGHVRFFKKAVNNRLSRSKYRSCDGDGTGSGSNSCG